MRRLAGAITVLLLTLVLAGSAQAAHGSVNGTVSGAPAGATSEFVEAVSPQGVIGGVATVASSGAYDLSLAPGTWLLAGSAQTGVSALASFAAPLRVKAGHHVQAHTAPLKPSAIKAAARGLPAGAVVTIAPIIVHDERSDVTPGSLIE
ncbi:MAG TPA: hypothetical protein VH061_03100 [Solirubrobacteraceae bacterium]|nr:hypothetical protein [Solirubrobacteraceae bacterium]